MTPLTPSSRLERLAARYVRRAFRTRDVSEGAGVLVWVSHEGDAYALGTFTSRDLTGICDAVDIARRTSPIVGERARLSRFSHPARRLRNALQKVS